MQTYVKKGAETKYNPPSPMEGYNKTLLTGIAPDTPFKNLQKMPPMFQIIGPEGPKSMNLVNMSTPRSGIVKMHQEVKPDGKLETPEKIIVRTNSEKNADFVEDAKNQAKVKQDSKSNVPNQAKLDAISNRQKTLITGRPPNQKKIEILGSQKPNVSTGFKEGKTPSELRSWSEAEGPGSKDTKVIQWKGRKVFLGMPYLGLGSDIIHGLSTWKQSKKSGKEFNLGSFIPAWAKKIAYGEGIPKS